MNGSLKCTGNKKDYVKKKSKINAFVHKFVATWL